MSSKTLNSLPRQDGFHMPAEWAPQQAVWMIWPYRADNWRERGRPAQAAFAQVAKAIAAVTPVYMAVPQAWMGLAHDIMPASVQLVAINSDDCWARDTGPTLLVNTQGVRRGIDWRFNAWGGLSEGLYAPWDQDDKLAAAILAEHGFDRYEAPFILEGGSIHVDGEGTLLTTAECLLNPNRNPQLNRDDLELLLREYLNVETVIWLPEGVYMDETDGHIDNMACFVRPGEVLLHWTDDERDPQYARSQAAHEVLSRAMDARGRRLKIWKLPQPGPLYCTEDEAAGVENGGAVPRRAGERLAASYVNFLITNGRLVFPLLDPATDDEARAILAEIFPEHEVVGVPAREILLGGGNIHCITQQIPSGS